MQNQKQYWNKVTHAKSIIAFTICLFFFHAISLAQKIKIESKIDSLLFIKTTKPFNGVILISENNKLIYSKAFGYTDIENKKPLTIDNQFVIGSISKQFTAAMVLLQMEKGNLKLEDKISKYLPKLKQAWKDSVTIYHLLTHTHGIVSIDKPLSFAQGTKMDYEHGNNIGYKLLSEILENISGKSFAKLSAELFEMCGMKNTFHPDIKKYKKLVKGYTEQKDGRILFDSSSFQASTAAGGFISTANDLLIWNKQLNEGKILKYETYNLMTSIQPNITREHPLWGATNYGLGLTINNKENILQLGQTGFAPGFVSMNYYFPKSKTSIVVLENITYDSFDMKKTFYYHIAILQTLKKCLLQ